MPSRLPSLGLYVHIPWCIRKCPYCDFNSHALSGQLDEAGYINALLLDLTYELSALPGLSDRLVETLFIGGGTPSLLSADSIASLLKGIRNQIACSDKLEVTLEANPGTLEVGRFEGFAQAGVNRLSIGVQSFSQDSLQRIGRIHGADEAHAAIASAKSAGFERLNLDLMCGLPGQTLEMALDDVKIAIAASPDHISYYQMTLEPNTPFYRTPPAHLPPDDFAYEFQRLGRELLVGAGFAQYEVSAYARDGHYCRHNLNYWGFGDYIGIGAGAHSKITTGDAWTVCRRSRVRGPDRYVEAAGHSSVLSATSYLNDDDLVMEFMMNALRLKRGIHLEHFSEVTGLESSRLWPHMQIALDRGLLCQSGGMITTTELGWAFLDDTVAVFLQ
ncbi:MAG: radical SAM family heme chaperone HemW [Sedimenticola sp.]|nr:radical SAM family heme chaperone HemW [Sedimenticola sp.]